MKKNKKQKVKNVRSFVIGFFLLCFFFCFARNEVEKEELVLVFAREGELEEESKKWYDELNPEEAEARRKKEEEEKAKAEEAKRLEQERLAEIERLKKEKEENQRDYFIKQQELLTEIRDALNNKTE